MMTCRFLLVITMRLSFRQSLTLREVASGPEEAAGKDVASVVKNVDPKLVSVGVMTEKPKSRCKGCPTVSPRVCSTIPIF